jgi:hypothetical protein
MSQNFYKARLNEMFHGCVFAFIKNGYKAKQI